MTDDHVHAIQSLAHELARAGDAGAAARNALTSTVDLAKNGEPDTATDDLCHVIAWFRIELTTAQRAELSRLARALGVDDLVDEAGRPTPTWPHRDEPTPGLDTGSI
ncbi:hypothetical protein H3146_27635 [Streptomyces sp. OF3]|uniref:Uncharacterized protein n=1 Tax=Streptomyces alkaliterrae TaxID=2213162 RepID=A0A7W3WRD3_9ACTN|nr:hypothetical protein [Streptomyces alkaliterrae]MBB1257071.1 hypothetical protein [Streptomyces alkaliterrae]